MKRYLLYDGAGQLVAAGDTLEETVDARIATLEGKNAKLQKELKAARNTANMADSKCDLLRQESSRIYDLATGLANKSIQAHKEARKKTECELHAVSHAYDLLLETTVELHRRHSTHIGDTFPGFVERLADERDNLAARLRAMDESTASCAAVQVMAHVVCPVHLLLRAEKAPPCPTCGHVRAECTTIQEDEPPLFYQGIGAMRFARHLLSILDEKAKDGEQR